MAAPNTSGGERVSSAVRKYGTAEAPNITADHQHNEDFPEVHDSGSRNKERNSSIGAHKTYTKNKEPGSSKMSLLRSLGQQRHINSSKGYNGRRLSPHPNSAAINCAVSNATHLTHNAAIIMRRE